MSNTHHRCEGSPLIGGILESTAFDLAISGSLLPHRMQFFLREINLDSIIKVEGFKKKRP